MELTKAAHLARRWKRATEAEEVGTASRLLAAERHEREAEDSKAAALLSASNGQDPDVRGGGAGNSQGCREEDFEESRMQGVGWVGKSHGWIYLASLVMDTLCNSL